MHDDAARGESFWNFVAAFIDERDLRWLRREWNDDAMFLDVAIHVTSCGHCLDRRRFMVKSWESPVPGGEIW